MLYKHLGNSVTLRKKERKKKGDRGGELFNMKSEDICMYGDPVFVGSDCTGYMLPIPIPRLIPNGAKV